ncbi:MAG: TIGR01212 family radical SAM protein [Deferribacteraceae bacterium]|jgi:radical SAM protein (TIGR01212 family)|nr:TIGR01212 family radical SAM protein [Deferribacteraceae bacterium]
MKRYNDLKSFLLKRYGVKMVKISLDGGFTCPNRDGSVGVGGCIFCDERGSREKELDTNDISLQISKKVEELVQKKEAEKFIAYFQNFSGTYGALETLRKKYTAALAERVAILSIGTRADCINEDILRLLADIAEKEKVDVWIELGLQTSSDLTAEIINRCCKTELFSRAVDRIKSYGFEAVAHLMFGLPGESEQMMLDTVRYAAASGISGVKFHAVYIMKGTVLEELFNRGEYKAITRGEYLNIIAKAIPLLPTSVVVHRLVSSCKRETLIAPLWVKDKPGSLNAIEEKFERDNIVQASGL